MRLNRVVRLILFACGQNLGQNHTPRVRINDVIVSLIHVLKLIINNVVYFDCPTVRSVDKLQRVGVKMKVQSEVLKFGIF